MTKSGALIKELMKKKGLSQGDVAKHFGFSSPQFVSNTTRGISLWPAKRVKGLCKLLDFSVSKFLKLIEADIRSRSQREIDSYRSRVK